MTRNLRIVMVDASKEGISQRIAEAIGDASDAEVVERFARLAGYDVSTETVRRYRKGLAERIDARFVAVLTMTFPVSTDYLLHGVTRDDACSPEVRLALKHIADMASTLLEKMGIEPGPSK